MDYDDEEDGNELPLEFVSGQKKHVKQPWVAARDKELTPEQLASKSLGSAQYKCEVT